MLKDGDGEIIPVEEGDPEHQSAIWCRCRPFLEETENSKTLYHRPFDLQDERHEEIDVLENRYFS